MGEYARHPTHLSCNWKLWRRFASADNFELDVQFAVHHRPIVSNFRNHAIVWVNITFCLRDPLRPWQFGCVEFGNWANANHYNYRWNIKMRKSKLMTKRSISTVIRRPFKLNEFSEICIYSNFKCLTKIQNMPIVLIGDHCDLPLWLQMKSNFAN